MEFSDRLRSSFAALRSATVRGVRALAAVGLACVALAQLVAAPVSDQLNFRRFTSRDGLPAQFVYSIIRDSRGFMWFGTADGLARFDGHTFRVFRPERQGTGNASNFVVMAIQEDANGDLWLATEGGLEVWRRDTEQFTHYRPDQDDPHSAGDEHGQCLLREADGMLWVGTRTSGLKHFDPRTGKFERVYSQIPAPGDSYAHCLLRDRNGVLWMGTDAGGLQRLDPGAKQLRAYLHNESDPHSLVHNNVAALAEDREGNLWVGTAGGLCRLDPQRLRFEHIPLVGDNVAAKESQSITALVVDRDGKINIGTLGSGLMRYDPVTRKFTQHRHSRYVPNSLAADSVFGLYEAPDGDLWIGHFPSGVSQFDRSSAGIQAFFGVPGETNTLSDDMILSFLEDPTGDLWVGTDNGGLNHWSAATKTWRSFRHSPTDPTSLGGKAALSLLRDRRGTLWAGSWEGGLNRFQPETGTFHRYLPVPGDEHSISHATVWQLAEDHDGNLWIGTIGGGINRYVPGEDKFVRYLHDPANPRSINNNVVTALLIARDGTLWAGTPSGVAHYDRATDSWDRLIESTGGRRVNHDSYIFDMLEDRHGLIWITTEGAGLIRIDPRTGESASFHVSDGLPSELLRGIMEDDEGTLWFGSTKGLVRFDPSTHALRIFDEENGLPSSQFNPHARLRLTSGDLLFGTTQGFVRLDPRQLKGRSDPPPVVLTEFEVFNEAVRPNLRNSVLTRSITESSRIELPAALSVIAFEYSALSYTSPNRVQYRVKLEGFETEWRNPGNEHRVTFTNLDPGQYRLRVKAASGDGVWNEQGVSLDLVVIPPWWRTWWFRGALALGFLGSAATVGWAVSANRLREQQRQRELAAERERAHELEMRVAERTSDLATAVKELEAFSYSVSHDLRAPLRSMHGFSRVLLEDFKDKVGPEGEDSLRRICAASERMGCLIDDLLNLSRVSREEMIRGPVDLSALATSVAEDLRRTNPQQTIEFQIAPDLTAYGDARLLQIALVNLLGNACKFSSKRPVSQVEFGATVQSGKRRYFVRDNGAGFDMNYAQKMFGAFQRFHSSAEFPGTGIGLATVQRIIHRHGGEVTAESAPDQGATFYFSLPDPT
jgi:ligand-binding sensor domain-containing protein/signal transduction histidine kinase